MDRWRGRRVRYDLRPYLSRLHAIDERAAALAAQGDAELRAAADALHRAARDGPPLDELLVEVFALVREVADRALGLRAFDVQLVGGMVLFEGAVIEMETGEGKTLAAVAPAALRALAGRGVHIHTFNDYLARRDAAWMGPVYARLGLTVGVVTSEMTLAERRQAYAADVTYCPAKEAGFDHLRDGLVPAPGARVHRALDYAIVDEADSILIDEARIPLIIAGSHPARPHSASRMAALARQLEPGVHFRTDDAQRNVFLTDAGLQRVEAELGLPGSLYDPASEAAYTEINLALHARALLARDVDYIVREGRVELVDELTGRVVADRHWPDGLQAAVEAREGLRFRDDGVVLGSITLQHFYEQYATLAGMTATARSADEELQEFYGLGVVVLPPHRPCIRQDRPDRVFTHRAARDQALVAEVVQAHAAGRPVLVGTASVRESEALAAALRAQGLACAVLNAKTDAQEARIVAEAGTPGAVTISTNLAGRGTDIRLGGADGRDRAAVVERGGLYVLGANRHESERIDRQLRGRAGRQGDPGESRFLISLEDELIVRHGVDDVLPARRRAQQDGPLEDPRVRERIAWAQRVIDGQNLDIRRTLWRYSSFVERQRREVREQRDALLAQAASVERRVTLHHLDALWAEHLATLAEIREGIHIVRLGNQDPLAEFQKEANRAYQTFHERLDAAVADTLARLDPDADDADLARLGLKGPSSTWTYMVDDNPWRNALGLHISGSLGLSLAAAVYAPLFMAAAVYRRLFGRRDERA